MAITTETNGKNYRVLVTRFRNQSDLDSFSQKLGLTESVDQNTVEIVLPDMSVKNKKPSVKRSKKEKWKATWKGQPYFINEEKEAYAVVRLLFDEDIYDTQYIAELMEQNITENTRSTWVPKNDTKGVESYLRIIGGSSETHFPVYVISKGRAEKCLTSIFLSMCEVEHYVVVEEFQYNDYMSTVGQSQYTTVLTIPQSFFDEYETLYIEEDGETRLTGPGAARNFCWYHSKTQGFFAHHVLDDNIRGFYMLSDNCKFKVRTGAFIRAMEEHFMAFDNVALAGPCYLNFAPKNENRGCHIFNTRIYSWLLIRNDIPFKWRGRYNEDTILSLDVLKAGWSTLQWYFYLQNKVATQSMSGGNTDEFYKEEGTLRKSQMLMDVHGDVSKVAWRYGRWHHMVDYSPFSKNDPQFHPERLQNEIDDYGMYTVKIDQDDDYTINPQADTKTALEEKYGTDKAVYKFDGTRWQGSFDLYEDFKEKGY